jgi:hypothetical protein
MPVVEMPDGKVIQFPDNMSEADINTALASEIEAPKPEVSMTESAIRGAGQGATLGAADEIMSGIGTAYARLTRPDLFEDQSIADTYREGRGIAREADKAAQEANPLTYLGGNVAGSIATMKALPTVMPTKGATVMQRVGNAAASGGVYGAASGLGSSEADLTNGEIEQAALDSATGAGTGAVLGGVLQGAMDSPAIARAVARKATGFDAGKAADFADSGIDPSLAAVSNSPFIKVADSALQKTPGASGVMSRRAEDTLSQVSGKLDDLGANKGVTPQEAGEVLGKGVSGYVQRFKNTANSLYKQVDARIPGDSRVGTDNLRKTLSEEIAPYSNDPEFMGQLPKTVRELHDIFQGKETPEVAYTLLKRMRTDIGDKLSKASLLGDENTASLKKLYGALTEDMGAAAQAQGPKALNAWKRANEFYKRGSTEIEQNLQATLKKANPEKMFQDAMSQTKLGGTKIENIMKALSPDEREVISGTVLKRMGLAKPGGQDAGGEVFSPTTFLTNWNAMSLGAKKALFSGKNAQYSRDLDSLVKTIGNLKDVSRYGNPSGTASHNLAYGTGGAFLTALFTGNAGIAAGIAGGAATANAAARLITNPSFVRWMAREGVKANQPAFIKGLGRFVAQNPSLERDVGIFAGSFGGNAQRRAEKAQ